MRRLLVRVLHMRRRTLTKHRDRMLELIESYGGVTQTTVILKWRGEVAETQRKLDDVEARLHRAGAL